MSKIEEPAVPQPIKLVHVLEATKGTRYVELHIHPQAVITIRQLGSLRQQQEGDRYTLLVSPLYDFEEVLAFLQSLADVPIRQEGGGQNV